jgi:radical SAM-linked protein
LRRQDRNRFSRPIDILPSKPKIEPLDTARRLQDQHHYRVFYRKTGILRFIAHLDWMRMLFRWISSLKLETVFTQGFNPHPKVSLSPPLPLGISGEEEYFDVSYFEPYAPQIIADKFAETNIPDFQIIRVEKTGNKAMLPAAEELKVQINPLFADQVAQAIAQFRSQDEHLYTKKTEKREKTYDLSRIITEISLEGNEIRIIKDLQSPSLYGILESILGLSRKTLYSFEISRLRFIYR